MRIPQSMPSAFFKTPSVLDSSKKSNSKEDKNEPDKEIAEKSTHLHSEPTIETAITWNSASLDFMGSLLNKFVSIKLTSESILALSNITSGYLHFLPKTILIDIFNFIMNTLKSGCTEAIKIELIMGGIKRLISQVVSQNETIAEQVNYLQQMLNSLTDWMGDENDAVTYPVFILLFSLAISQQSEFQNKGYFSRKVNEIINQCLTLINFIQGIKIESPTASHHEKTPLSHQTALDVDIVGVATADGFSEIKTNSTLTMDKCHKATVENKNLAKLKTDPSIEATLPKVDLSPIMRLLNNIKNDYGIYHLFHCDSHISRTNETINGENRQHYYQHIGCGAVKNGEHILDKATLQLPFADADLPYPDLVISPQQHLRETTSASFATSTSLVTNLMMAMGVCAAISSTSSSSSYSYNYQLLPTASDDNDYKSLTSLVGLASLTLLGIITYIQYFLIQNKSQTSSSGRAHSEDPVIIPRDDEQPSDPLTPSASLTIGVHEPVNISTRVNNTHTNTEQPTVMPTLAAANQNHTGHDNKPADITVLSSSPHRLSESNRPTTPSVTAISPSQPRLANITTGNRSTERSVSQSDLYHRVSIRQVKNIDYQTVIIPMIRQVKVA